MELWTVGMIVRCERETYCTLLCNLKKKKNKRTLNESIRCRSSSFRRDVQKFKNVCFFFLLKVLKSNVKCKQMLSKEKCCYMWLFFFPTKKSEHNYLIIFQKVKKSKKKKKNRVEVMVAPLGWQGRSLDTLNCECDIFLEGP